MRNEAAGLNTGPVLEATAILLTNNEWRQRVVERVVPVSTDHYELKRSYQFEIPPDLMTDAGPGEELDVLLPVCWMAKTALLDFDITDANGRPMHVLERKSIAGSLATILDGWKEDITTLKGLELPADRLESVCAASLDPWETARQRGLKQGTQEVDWVCDYLNALLDFRVAPADVAEDFEVGKELSQRLYQLIDRDSSPEDSHNTLTVGAILAPYLVPRPSNVAELKKVISGHQRSVGSAITIAGQSDLALGWLALAAEAGVRWPLLVRTRITIGEPFLVKMREVRDSGRQDDPRVFVHRADLNTARSYHLQVQAPDQSVTIPNEPVATRADGSMMGVFDLFENSDLTRELFATYTSLDPRPDWVDVVIKFRLRWQSAIGYWYALALAVPALASAVFHPVDVTLAGLLTIPTTLVSALLLARETPLTARYLQWWRVSLVVVSVSLWVIAGWKALIAGAGCPSC